MTVQENHLFREQALPEHFWKQRMRSRKNILEIEMSRRVLLTIKAELRFLMYILRIMLV